MFLYRLCLLDEQKSPKSPGKHKAAHDKTTKRANSDDGSSNDDDDKRPAIQ
jgi:hypothetical protein